MAGKEANVYCVDLGSTTGKKRNGRTESDLDYGLKYLWGKLGDAMAANRVGLGVGVVGIRTDESDNMLSSDEEYENISILKPLGQMVMGNVEGLKAKLVPSDTSDGDAISAIVVAIQMIEDFTTLESGKPGKFKRKIVVLNDGRGAVDDSSNDDIAERLKALEIELLIVGIDFDDLDFGFKEEDKPQFKRDSEQVFKDLVEKCGQDVGTFATAAEVIQSLSIPEIKKTRPYKTFDGRLCLGDPENYPETALFIDVQRYFKTHKATPLSASSYVTRGPNANGGPSNQSSHTLDGDVEMAEAPDLSAVRMTRTYQINDATDPRGKRDVDREELSKGYEYGRTAVPVSEIEENVTKYETIQSFSIIGFIPNDKYERYLNMAESCLTTAPATNDKARMALSSLIHALFELESYAVARLVKKTGNEPLIVLMAPLIEPDCEALIDITLPFAEDLRIYRFPPLDRVITTSGTTLTEHRNLPTKELSDAMSDYVDAMDLSEFGKDDEGNPAEYMPIEETYHPMVHRITQALRQRATHPNDPVGPPAEILTKWSNPPVDLVKSAAPQLHKLLEVASVKKVPPKAKGRYRREVIKPLSGLDVESLLNREKRQKISKENAVPEFKQMLNSTTDDNTIIDAANQMGEIVRRQVTDSGMGNVNFHRAAENLRVLRTELVEFEMFDLYNSFIRDFKKRLFKGELGGDKVEFFFEMRKAKLGLISKNDLEVSDATAEQAKEFWDFKSELPTRIRH